jgi:hypothetical protein
MDPNTTLRRISELLATEGLLSDEGREVLANHAADLREWLCRGGFAPDWDAHPEAAELVIHG